MDPRAPGTTVIDGRYRIIRELGSGAVGVVYEAEHLELGGRVALKLLDPRLAPSEREGLFRDVRAMHRLHSPHTVRVLDIGETPPGFFVMELLAGRSLTSELALHPRLPWARALEIVRQVLVTLSEAHGIGLLHGAIKPSNIFMVARPDRSDVVKLIDYGSARVSTASPSLVATIAGDVAVGHSAYASPEQVAGASPDTRSDLFSLGVVFYQMLTGQLPFPGVTREEIAAAHRTHAFAPPSQLEPSVSPRLDDVFRFALAPNPAERFQTAEAFVAALDRVSPRMGPSPVSSGHPAAIEVRPFGASPAPVVGAARVGVEGPGAPAPAAMGWAQPAASAPTARPTAGDSLRFEVPARPEEPPAAPAWALIGGLLGLVLLLGIGLGAWLMRPEPVPPATISQAESPVAPPARPEPPIEAPPAPEPLQPVASSLDVGGPEPVASAQDQAPRNASGRARSREPAATETEHRDEAPARSHTQPSVLPRSPTDAQMRLALERARGAVERCMDGYSGDLEVSVTFFPEGTVKANIGQGPTRDARYCAQAAIHHTSGIAFIGSRTALRYTFRGLGAAEAATLPPPPTSAQMAVVLERLRPFVLQCVNPFRGPLDVSVKFAADGRVSSNIGSGPTRDARYCVQREINARAGQRFRGTSTSIRYTFNL